MTGTAEPSSGANVSGDRLYFRQLLAGRDFATDSLMARQMVNFVYLIGDREKGEAVVVDPAYDVDALVDLVESDGMRLTGALATHYHADHVGGSFLESEIEGIGRLLERVSIPIHVHDDEKPWVARGTGVAESELVGHRSGDKVIVGDIEIELIHTPGHTPGSQCFFVADRLVSGDTLFLDGCGRTDLPGSDPALMYESLTQRLAKIPDRAVLYPGHLYSELPSAPMGETRERNFVLQPRSLDEWMALFGR